MKSLVDAVKAGSLLVSDGAWGTFLQLKGLKPGECPELWNLDRPDDVAAVARSYVEAGADMVQTNSFGANRLKLAHYGLAERASEINEAAARLSRQEAGPNRWVIASMGPTGKFLITEEVTEAELLEAFGEQARALELGGADALCVETMSDLQEACLAVRAAKAQTRLEVICTFTFDRQADGSYRTMMGLSPAEAARGAVEAGADVIGSNCGNGLAGMVEIVAQMRKACPETPILVHANAGLPVHKDGKDVYPETPALMASQTEPLIRAGANILGGCCGTTPAHIAELARAVRLLWNPQQG
ncbi:MAG: homocysteine S-methyltransferase family protein [Spirochaetales bacterium]